MGAAGQAFSWGVSDFFFRAADISAAHRNIKRLRTALRRGGPLVILGVSEF